MVHPTDPHSCFSAAAHRAHRDAERAVIEAAKAMVGVVHPPKIENYREYMAALDNLVVAVVALRALERNA
jgi:hypothetical protein